jgi:ABC-type polar amino acid transport system ATPase subunit
MQLSGGQQQRVAIARALAMEPKGLLCDEITSALDPELKNEVLNALENLKRDGMTLLMVTHEIGFARKAADRIVVLAEGKLIENGPPSDVLDNPRSPRMRQFLSRVLG